MKWWYNGEMVEPDNLKCSLTTYSLHYGVCVFEGMRARGDGEYSLIFRLQDHVDRFFNSLRVLGVNKIGFNKEQLSEAIISVVKNSDVPSLYIRPLFYYGDGVMGIQAKNLDENLAVTAWNWDVNKSSDKYTNGIRVKITRHNRFKNYSQAKVSGNYLSSFSAVNELGKEQSEYDEVVLLDEGGFVCEGSAQNIFMLKSGVLYTPYTTSCLAGITRKTVMDIADLLGVSVVEKNILPSDLLTCDEAFLTGTASEIIPIREVDGYKLPITNENSVVRKVMKEYDDLVNGKTNYSKASLTELLTKIKREN